MKYYILLSLIIGVLSVDAQNRDDKYVVITLERERSWDNHLMEYSYWIIPADSLGTSDSKFSLLYLNGFSRNNFESCCLNDSIVMNNTVETNFDFTQTFTKQIETLKEIIDKRRKKLQVIKKSWNKNSEKITVYVTPVIGEMCKCKIAKAKQIQQGLQLIMPKSGYKLGEFDLPETLLFYDFAQIPFINLNSIL